MTGSSAMGDGGASGEAARGIMAPPRAHPLEHRVPPPIVLAVTLGLTWLASRFLPTVAGEVGVLRWSGATLMVAGFLIAAAGANAFRRAQTTINPVAIDAASSLVTGGIFSYTRNPMYLGMSLIASGWALLLTVPWLLAFAVAFVLFIQRFQIEPEERMMAAKFGSAYAAYRQRVRRWV